MISGGRNFKEIERKKIGKKSEQKQSKNRVKTRLYETSQPEENFCENSTLLPNHSATLWDSLREFLQLRRRVWHTSATSQHKSPHFEVAKLQSVKMPIFAVKASFCRVFRSCKTKFGTRVPFCSTVTLLSKLRNGLRSGLQERFFTAKSTFFCET